MHVNVKNNDFFCRLFSNYSLFFPIPAKISDCWLCLLLFQTLCILILTPQYSRNFSLTANLSFSYFLVASFIVFSGIAIFGRVYFFLALPAFYTSGFKSGGFAENEEKMRGKNVNKNGIRSYSMKYYQIC